MGRVPLVHGCLWRPRRVLDRRKDAGLLCTDAKSKARVGAEEAFAAHDAVILRLGGIYGPGRSLLDAQRRTASTSEKPVNRIHVDDIAGALIALADRDVRATYNVVDDDPTPRSAVAAFADELIGPAPATGAAKPSRGTGSKRCRNEKLREVYDLIGADVQGRVYCASKTPTPRSRRRRGARAHRGGAEDLQAVALADQRADVSWRRLLLDRESWKWARHLAAASAAR